MGVFVTLTVERWGIWEVVECGGFGGEVLICGKIGVVGFFWSFTRKWEWVVMLWVCFVYASLNNRCRSLVGVLEELRGVFSVFVFGSPL